MRKPTTKNKLTRSVPLKLTQELYERLKTHCDRQERSVNFVVTKFIERGLDEARESNKFL